MSAYSDDWKGRLEYAEDEGFDMDPVREKIAELEQQLEAEREYTRLWKYSNKAE